MTREEMTKEVERIVNSRKFLFKTKLGMIDPEVAKYLQYTHATKGFGDNGVRLHFETSSFGIGFSLHVRSEMNIERFATMRSELYSAFRELKYEKL